MDTSKIKINNQKVVLNTINAMLTMLIALQKDMFSLQSLIDLGTSIPGAMENPVIVEIVAEHKITCEIIDDLKNYIQNKKEKYNEKSKSQ